MHVNLPNCPGCEVVFDRYPGFHAELRQWVYHVRSLHTDAHISAAGRNKADQEHFYITGASRAHYGQSAHNWNAAVDWFRITLSGGASFDAPWYKAVIGPEALKVPWIRWYGTPPISFLEYPHCEVSSWREMARAGTLQLVDGPAAFPIPS